MIEPLAIAVQEGKRLPGPTTVFICKSIESSVQMWKEISRRDVSFDA